MRTRSWNACAAGERLPRRECSSTTLRLTTGSTSASLRKPGRSPSFYGLAAQELEAEKGGTFLFLEGASGSTHNLSLPAASH